jgi:hypothetical protein
MAKQKPFFLGITGQTSFHNGNIDNAIAVDIAMGYVKTNVSSKTEVNQQQESNLYASFTVSNNKVIGLRDLIKACTPPTVKNSEQVEDSDRVKIPDQVEIPDFLDAFGFKKFSVNYGTKGSTAANTKFSIGFDSHIKINKKVFEVAILVNYEKTGTTVSFSFSGKLKVDEHQFDLQFTKSDDEWYLFASYHKQRKIKIDLKAIAGKFFGEDEVKDLPSVSFKLDKFKAFLLYKSSESNPGMLFGMGAGVNLDLNDLPLAGPILAKEKAFQFKEVLAIYSTGSFTKESLAAFNMLPQGNITSGFNISAELLINGRAELCVLNGGVIEKGKKARQQKPSKDRAKELAKEAATPVANRPKLNEAAPIDGSISSKAMWKEVDKKIGPVSIQRLGFLYKDGKVVLLLDASMEMAGMGLQLMGLGLGFELKWPPPIPDFYIDGIGISYNIPPIEIAGAFLHSVQDYKGRPTHVYSGGAILKIAWFTISAIGSYAKVWDEDSKQEMTSLFIYGVFNGPIGGPSFFFVTGIAAGFGYNRRVNVPSIEEVAMFPLVALAMKPEKEAPLMAVLASLETEMKNGKKPIDISIGDYWLALGIRFSSFKLLDTFVLVTINFGTALEFAILGLSRLSWPEESMRKGADPIVYIELAILAHFGPASDVISVEAIITPNSYLFSKDCHLTGGFAFYAWVKGEHEGDFVVTLGGYHKKFKKPDHYPTVPRVGLNWKISDSLIIKGEMYFALTSTAIMAGGRWEVLFTTSVVSVSLVVWADMLISWAPFEYDIHIGVWLKVDLNILIHISFELSAELHIWGPPFSGDIYVNLSIFSFTIPFGDHAQRELKKLTWDEFSKGFIPQKKVEETANKETVEPAGADPINITISNGLIDVKELEGGVKISVINPYQLAISVESFIPVKRVLKFTKAAGEVEVGDETEIKCASGDPLKYAGRVKKIGIRPCGFTSDNVELRMSVKVTLKEAPVDMTLTCLAKGVAEALWGPQPSENSNSNPGTAEVISNVITGMLLQPSQQENRSTIKEFDFSKLCDDKGRTFNWTYKNVRIAEAYHASDVLGRYEKGQIPGEKPVKMPGVLERTYASVSKERAAILSLLITEFDDSLSDVPDLKQETAMESIMVNAAAYFKAAPVICEIGHIPQYSTDVN